MAALKGADGKISIESVIHFTMSARSDLMQAANDFAAWQKANPDAGPMATELARSAAILEANNTLLGGQYSAQNLKDFASQNPGLSPSLDGGAKMWAQPGMLHFLDQAGQNILETDPDRLVNGGNIHAWLTQGLAPVTDDDAMSFINEAATRSVVAGIDTSNLDSDIFEHPEKHTGAEKAAALQELRDTQAKLLLANGGGVLDADTQMKGGVNPNIYKTNADLQNKIDILQNDPDVQAFLSQTTPLSFQAIVNADPDMKAAINASYQKFQSGSTLNDDLNMKDANGNPISQADALHMFVGQAGFFQLANGQDGKMGTPPALTAVAKNSGKYQDLLDYFNSNVASAKDLGTFLSKDAVNGSSAFTQEIEDYMSVLDPSDAKAGGESLLDNVDNTLLGNLTFDQLNAAIGDGNGNVDDAKLDKFISQLDPSISGSADDKSTKKGLIVTIVKDFFAMLRNGTLAAWSFNEMAKDKQLADWMRLPLATKQAMSFKYGAFHFAGAILGSIALGFLAKGTPPSDPAQIAQLVGLVMGPVGQLINIAGRVTNRFFEVFDGGKNMAQANAAYDEADEKLKRANASKETATTVLKRDRREMRAAVTNLRQAERALDKAQKQRELDEGPDAVTITQDTLDTAKAEETAAKTELNKAVSDKLTASRGESVANDEVTAARNEVAAARSEYDTAEAKAKAAAPEEREAALAEANRALNDLEDAKSELAEKQKVVTDARRTLREASNAVTIAERKVGRAAGTVARAQTALDNAEAVRNAKSELTRAQNKESKASEKVRNDTAALDSAEEAVKTATTEKTEAKNRVKDARSIAKDSSLYWLLGPDITEEDDPASHGSGSGKTSEPVGDVPPVHAGEGVPDPPRYLPAPPKYRIPAVGGIVGGVGGLIAGAAGFFNAPADAQLRKLNYANSALAVPTGAADTADGLLFLFGRDVTPSFGTVLGEWSGLIDGTLGVVGAAVGFGIAVAEMMMATKKEHASKVRVTELLNGTLAKYGVTGGHVTGQDQWLTGPLQSDPAAGTNPGRSVAS